ncbi:MULTISPECIES: calcium/sodium antiporter [Clostridium]|jgi:cation:H+ antiporter|uniref:calcium/sodium antiporter n=1 Tax=Clostridium TaxID=1485 RepID=UPI0018AA56F9|nr:MULTISPECIES: calcium/sodium antiporter [Clostridium]MBS5305028.1 calcium/sodium antiporter [Clostridium sp.]MDB1932302.1 calcium/sodium antiporter [Clostridium tertium]MDB1936454.1 calcium/sodium antiporter [Clostridium tertium]MDB1942966.1 calcium/sodium antiporter [Clostridium tertium]MDB1950067.1 calcium/sodium antiporter [Clostridium tertium]
MSYLILIIGFILLIKGADIFVDGAAKIAKKFGIPSIIVGLTIVSLGTSAPELSVSLIASFEGNNGITIGNVLGSNIFNTLMVLGVTAIIMPIVIKKNSVIKDYIINIVVSIVLLVLTFGRVLLNKEAALTRISGIILLILCIIYTLYLIKSAKSRKEEEDFEEEEDIKILSCIIKIILGIIGIIAGGNLVVSSASDIAYSFGLSDKLVGLTIVAVGTSLPELVTTMIASIKGENDIAIGNVLGSNIFNILLILGVSSSINAIPISSSLLIDILFLIVISIILGIFMFKGKKDKLKLDKLEGLILVLLYIGYMIYIISRN